MRTTKRLGAAWIFLLAGGMRAQGLPHATTEHGAFAFPDRAGTRLLAVADLPRPEMFHTALCTGGLRFQVQFERRQAEREGNNGRQTPYNFDKLAGSVFRVLQGSIETSASCFLASGSLLSSATLLPAEPPAESGACAPDDRRRIASSRGRNVVNCWPWARLPEHRRLILVEFARQNRNALASVVLMNGDRLIFADYPAEFRGQGEDLWRVDDGGALSPEGFRVVFVLQRGASYVMGIGWSASEGTSLAVFVSGSGDRFTRVIADYWYQMPI